MSGRISWETSGEIPAEILGNSQRRTSGGITVSTLDVELLEKFPVELLKNTPLGILEKSHVQLL